MLSNPPNMSGLHSRQRQHRRQNSTPSAFEAVKIAPLPSFQQRPHTSHRRGLSLDTRGQQPGSTPRPITPRPSYPAVSMSGTNPGTPTTPQHVLREAQQQRTARPGPSLPIFTQQESDAFLMSPQVTFPGRQFATEAAQGPTDNIHGLSLDLYSGSFGMDYFGADSALSTPSFMNFPDSSPAGASQGWISDGETASNHSRRGSRRISNGILDKVAKFEALDNGPGSPSLQRPCTPNSQTGIGYFTQTPVQTPIKQEPDSVQVPSRFSEGYDESMEETLKPIRKRPSNRNSGIFQDFRQQAEAMATTPPRTGSIPMAMTSHVPSTPDFMDMRKISAEFKKIESSFESFPTCPPEMQAMPSPVRSGTPDLVPRGAFELRPNLQPPIDFASSSTTHLPGGSSPASKMPSRRCSPHRRADSIASMTSAASIADINIEETRTETGVTLEDIAAFIQGPDPTTGKWVCLYENCNKPFGRKENIKSHVQTHLNDRQYQCPTCKKCFVRQHDLKRHAKIHTGIKPYPCQCGQSFARHDALTRHRQRGMCIGAVDGVVRKVAKRGRPKKIRPEMEERKEKAERTRRKNKLTEAEACSASSQSGYSDTCSSAANSPRNDFDGLLEDDQFPGITETALLSMSNAATMDPTNLGVSSAPMPSTLSGSFSAMSPSATSDYSHTSHTSHASVVGGNTILPHVKSEPYHNHHNAPPSPAKSTASHYTHGPCSPPGLSSTGSPPPTGTSARFFELNSDANNTSMSSEASIIGLGTTAAANLAASSSSSSTSSSLSSSSSSSSSLQESSATPLSGSVMVPGLAESDDLSFLQFSDDGLVSLDHGSLMLAVGSGKFEKFTSEDEFDPVSMFTNMSNMSGDDLYFGPA
ncbi:uncharacterized protein B0T15DRAFT_217092 [Chaetomium strumarium]|uniref:C2H2-type domain-containing protein n=1 Tax=Chaetomium strumarium TaxID=1170767 RepID=A0AAJ0M1Z0_9PEZI|nr:hypothetical protein B0T15DRAFT_217092 [Chaetomium strumarium]